MKEKQTPQIADVLENISEGVVTLDENRCFTYVNQYMGKILDLEAAYMIGKNIWGSFLMLWEPIPMSPLKSPSLIDNTFVIWVITRH